MQKDPRDLLEVLKFELNFLEKGGYGRSPREPWRSPLIFEDSPTCMNYDCQDHPGPCLQCVLIQLVPEAEREKKIPCRHIPLTAARDTLDSLYRWNSLEEVTDIVRSWLRETIERMEEERNLRPLTKPENPTASADKNVEVSPNTNPKCANPACATAFRWLAGGKFFRFHAVNGTEPADAEPQEAMAELRVKHFWLCERCCRIYTLVYAEESGVAVRPLFVELAAVAESKQLAAS